MAKDALDEGKIRWAMKHKDELGAGAKKRKKVKHAKDKKEIVRREWERGTLYSGSGKRVPKSRPDIMWAIANSEARRHG